MSYSVGWALAKSPVFLRETLNDIGIKHLNLANVIVRLQTADPNLGITDLEIESPGEFHLVFEAKRGWQLPHVQQLAKYAERLAKSPATDKGLVALTECSPEFARHRLAAVEFPGIKVSSISWQRLAGIAAMARANGSHAEKRLLHELESYLGGLISMQKVDSNWVYVVSLASGTPQGWDISWIDIVKEKHRYFHPVGGRGWPKEPPNYIAFRYYGKLQSIHHVDDYEVVTNMHARIPDVPDEEWGPFFLYRLGPAFRPSKEVRSGALRNTRLWCMLDTLFTADTIREAVAQTKVRLAARAVSLS